MQGLGRCSGLKFGWSVDIGQVECWTLKSENEASAPFSYSCVSIRFDQRRSWSGAGVIFKENAKASSHFLIRIDHAAKVLTETVFV